MFIALLVGWGSGILLEGIRWKRHIRKFIDQEMIEQLEMKDKKIEERDEKIRQLKTQLKETEDDRDEKAIMLKGVKESIENM
jgi:hypothetical protein